jgi:hypothetical protein
MYKTDTLEEMQNHVATHLQRAALFALPRSTDLEDSSTVGNESSRDTNAELPNRSQGDLESNIDADSDDTTILDGNIDNPLTVESLRDITGVSEILGTQMRTREFVLDLELSHTELIVCEEPGCSIKEGFSTINDLERHKESLHKIAPNSSKDWGYLLAAAIVQRGIGTGLV